MSTCIGASLGAVEKTPQLLASPASPPLRDGDSGFLVMLDSLADEQSDLSRQWDQEHDQHITRQLLEQIKPSFEATTWTAFQRVALQGAAPASIAAELGITVNAVFIAKSRVMSRLRQEGRDLLD